MPAIPDALGAGLRNGTRIADIELANTLTDFERDSQINGRHYLFATRNAPLERIDNAITAYRLRGARDTLQHWAASLAELKNACDAWFTWFQRQCATPYANRRRPAIRRLYSHVWFKWQEVNDSYEADRYIKPRPQGPWSIELWERRFRGLPRNAEPLIIYRGDGRGPAAMAAAHGFKPKPGEDLIEQQGELNPWISAVGASNDMVATSLDPPVGFRYAGASRPVRERRDGRVVQASAVAGPVYLYAAVIQPREAIETRRIAAAGEAADNINSQEFSTMHVPWTSFLGYREVGRGDDPVFQGAYVPLDHAAAFDIAATADADHILFFNRFRGIRADTPLVRAYPHAADMRL